MVTPQLASELLHAIVTESTEGIGKPACLKSFLRFPRFNTGQCPNLSGTLVNLDPDSNGFIAFLCLVGISYYLKNQEPFESIPSSYGTIILVIILVYNL